MSQLLIFWISAGIFFTILELFTVTLYGISVGTAAFIVALYVWFTGDTVVNVQQAGIFLVICTALSYYLPKKFSTVVAPRSDNPIDMEVGNLFALKESKGSFRINIEGVDYLVSESCVTPEFADGKKVTLKSHTGSQVIVKIFSA